MLITKFNALIRNRFVWAFFGILVSIVFVGAFSNTEGCSPSAQTGVSAGTLFGKDVPRQQYAIERIFALGLRERTLTPAEKRTLHKRTWQRIAAIDRAPQLGIGVSDREVAETLQKDPNFQDNGAFSRAKYQQLVRNQMGVDLGTFERYVNEELMLRKLSSVFESAAWTAPSEADRRLRNLTDHLTIQYVFLATNAVVPSVKLSDADLRAFYDNHKDLFRIPDRVSVRWVEFPHSNFFASAKVDETDARAYYESHITEFESTDTNGLKRTTSFEEVATNIFNVLKADRSAEDAKDAATQFVVALAPDRNRTAPGFEALAAATGMVVHTTDLFSARQTPTNIYAGRSFSQAAFDLDGTDPERYFSDAIPGEFSVYVIATNTFAPARQPPFEEVIAAVRPAAEVSKRKEIFAKECDKIREAVLKAIESGKPFEQVASIAASGNSVTSLTFSAYNAITEEMEYADVLVPGAGQLQPGELADILPVRGGALLVFVKDRQPGDALSMAVTREELISTLNRYRSSVVFQEWQRHALKVGKLDDRMAFEEPAGREQEPEDAGEPSHAEAPTDRDDGASADDR